MMIFIAACTPKFTKTKEFLSPMIGKNADQAIVVLGVPNRTMNISNGEKVLTWEDTWNYYSHMTGGTYQHSCTKNLMVDNNNIIISYSFNDCP